MNEIPSSQEAILLEAARKHGWSDEKVSEFRKIIAEAYAASARARRPTYERAKQNDTAVHVYVMQAQNGDVKVGISQNPRWRAKALSTEWRGKPAIAWTSAARSRRQALEIERNAHLILGEDRLDGEWFSCSTHLAVAAIEDSEVAVLG